MPVNLPEGHTWRPATVADAEAIVAMVAKENLATIGFVDLTVADARNDLTEPGFTLETDSWLVHDPAGVLVGFGWAMSNGAGELVDVDVITPDDEVCAWLYERVLRRAAEMAAGNARCGVDQGIFRVDTRMRAAAAAHGFAPATTYHRMRVDHEGAAVDPVAPPGVTLRNDPDDLDLRRTAREIITGSFKEHYGFVDEAFERWHDALDNESTFDWSCLTVAELDGRPVAVLLTNRQYVEIDDCGYVAVLGVLPEARGRGIAKYLLRVAFAADIRAGRTGTILHVDTNNVTPALTLYESVGMRAVLVIDVWHRTVDPAGQASPTGPS